MSPTRSSDGARRAGDRGAFLPDFCAIPVVFSVVIIAQLLAFVLVVAGSELAAPARTRSLWGELALTSLFVQWVALTSAALLCALRRWLARAGDSVASAVSFAVVLAVTAVATEVGFWAINARWVEPAGHPGWVVAGANGSEHAQWAQWVRWGPPWQLLLGNLAISAIVAVVALRYFYVQHQWRRQLERESQARIQALHSRIRPHFLFNSMNTIASFTRTDPELAEQVVEDLAELFRVTLADARVPSPLGRELDLCRQYVRIEGVRLGDRLRVEWDVDDLPVEAEHALLPALTLQPLLENAVYHGIEPAPEGGVIRVSGRVRDGFVALRLTNTVTDGREPVRSGHRMALENVTERLTAFFGERGTVEVRSAPGLFAVTLHFPVVTEMGRT